MSGPMIRRRAASRRGVTLVELMVFLTAVSVMLGLGVMILGLAMRLETDGRSAFERSEALGRLSRRFRADVHGSRDAALDGATLRLESGPGRSVEYRVDEHGDLSRVVIDAGKESAREPYRIPQSIGARLELREIEGRRFAVLWVDVQARKDRIDPIRSVEILALAGKTSPTSPHPEGAKP